MTTIDVALLAEPRVYPGLTAAVNSLAAHGFDGNVWVGFRGAPPKWATENARTGTATKVRSCFVNMVPLATTRPFTYYKPAFLNRVLNELSPACDGVVYLDTDIVVNRAWTFFDGWVRQGVAVVEDLPGHQVGADHPERRAWSEWIDSLGLSVVRSLNRRFNAGFVGLPRHLSALLGTWMTLIDATETATTLRGAAHYISAEESTPEAIDVPLRVKTILEHNFHNDQDALNMALMATDVPISGYGPDGMGFTGSWNIPMAHAPGPLKPWNKNFVRHLLTSGEGPTIADIVWWRYATQPLPAMSRRAHARGSLNLLAARVADRVL